MEQDQETLSEYDSLVAELARAKAAGEAPVLPRGIVLDDELGFYRVRPCLEEFVAAGYSADTYGTWFTSATTGEDGAPRIPWGPGWSNSSWAPEQRELWKFDKLPAVLVVRSQVRRLGTRTTRARAPSRHRFKQFLFGDPSFRLVRNGERQVAAAMVSKHLDELIEKEAQGMLSVHFVDGRRLNLDLLKAGLVETDAAPLPAPQANPPLDSAANDDPSGIPIPTYIDGTYIGDPSAAATLEQMLRDKAAEQGELPGGDSDPLLDAPSSEDKPAEETPAEEPASDDVGDTSDPLAEKSELEAVKEEASDVPDVVAEEVPAPEALVEETKPATKSGKKGNKR